MDLRQESRLRVVARVGRIEPVDVGEQDEGLGADHRRDAGREAVVVAEADLLGRDRVVLVDHRYGVQADQGVERVAGVQIPPALFGVAERHQHLGHGDAVACQRLLPGVGEADLPGRGGRLGFLQPQRSVGQAKLPSPERDRAGRYDDDLLPAGGAARHVVADGV